MPDVSSVSEVLLIFATIGLGWWHTLPGFGVSDELMVELERLEKRQRTELGSLARRPLLLSYMDNSLLYWRNFLLPIGLNLGIWFGIGWTNPWFWIGMITVEAIAIFSIQGYRRYRFSRNSYRYLRMTQSDNVHLDAYIVNQTPECTDPALTVGHIIEVKGISGLRRQLFVCFPVYLECEVQHFGMDELVRIFYIPKDKLNPYLPDDVVGSVVGVELLSETSLGRPKPELTNEVNEAVYIPSALGKAIERLERRT